MSKEKEEEGQKEDNSGQEAGDEEECAEPKGMERKEEEMFNEKISEGERASLTAIADDSLKVFRAGLYMIVIYITIISLTLQTGGSEYVENIVNSVYTVNGAVFWFGSMTCSVLTHRMARRITLKEQYSQLGRIDDKFDVLNFVTACTVGLLISIFSLIFGLLAGWENTINSSAGGIEIVQPIGIIGLSFVMVIGIYSMLSVIDTVRDRWGPIRKILRMS